MTKVIDWLGEDLWGQLVKIAEVTGQVPSQVALDILTEGIKARIQIMTEQAEAEAIHLEAEWAAAKARLATLNNPEAPAKAPQRPVEPSYTGTSVYHHGDVLVAVRGVLGSDRQRTWTTKEVIEQLGQMGYRTDGMYQMVNNCLQRLVRDREARRPVRGQYTWRRRPNRT
jgi:hypothetical protein